MLTAHSCSDAIVAAEILAVVDDIAQAYSVKIVGYGLVKSLPYEKGGAIA